MTVVGFVWLFRQPENDLTLRVLRVLRERLNNFVSLKNKVLISHGERGEHGVFDLVSGCLKCFCIVQ